jgi:GxxExxY protein
MTGNAIAKEIVDAAFRVHMTLGPGLLESVYDTVLAFELGRRGLHTVRRQAIPGRRFSRQAARPQRRVGMPQPLL